jgi:hypothetical protein
LKVNVTLPRSASPVDSACIRYKGRRDQDVGKRGGEGLPSGDENRRFGRWHR